MNHDRWVLRCTYELADKKKCCLPSTAAVQSLRASEANRGVLAAWDDVVEGSEESDAVLR